MDLTQCLKYLMNLTMKNILKNLLGKSPKSELISNWKKCEYNDFGFYEVNNVFIP